MTQRYAVYAVAPEASILEQRAETWLGRSARTGIDVERPDAIAEALPDIDATVRSPRRYGFHGTLRAPITMADGYTPDDLAAAVADVADRHAPITVPLALETLSGFFALVPRRPTPAIDTLHRDVLEATDRLRAPPAAAEVARRRQATLSAQEEALLVRWGYPYVLDRFRFHMTLTGRLDAADAARVRPHLEAHLGEAIARPACLTSLAIFLEPASGADFVETSRIALSAPALDTRPAAGALAP